VLVEITQRATLTLDVAGQAILFGLPQSETCRTSSKKLAPISDCAYTLNVHITFNPEKNERNIRERGLSFELVAEFEFKTACIEADSRREYGETRYIALGRLNARLHVLCFMETADGIRVISFRKANDREVTRYAKVQTPD
jgi:uncharacterized DUF497 family protein